jgi:hypothetical protein
VGIHSSRVGSSALCQLASERGYQAVSVSSSAHTRGHVQISSSSSRFLSCNSSCMRSPRPNRQLPPSETYTRWTNRRHNHVLASHRRHRPVVPHYTSGGHQAQSVPRPPALSRSTHELPLPADRARRAPRKRRQLVLALLLTVHYEVSQLAQLRVEVVEASSLVVVFGARSRVWRHAATRGLAG